MKEAGSAAGAINKEVDLAEAGSELFRHDAVLRVN